MQIVRRALALSERIRSIITADEVIARLKRADELEVSGERSDKADSHSNKTAGANAMVSGLFFQPIPSGPTSSQTRTYRYDSNPQVRALLYRF